MMAGPELDLAAKVAHQRLVQGGVLCMGRRVVEEGSSDCPVATFGVELVGAGSGIDLKGVSERLAVGEERDAAQLKEPLVLGPGLHLLVLARHLRRNDLARGSAAARSGDYAVRRSASASSRSPKG